MALVSSSTFNATYFFFVYTLIWCHLRRLLEIKFLYPEGCKVADDRNATYWKFVETLILFQYYSLIKIIDSSLAVRKMFQGFCWNARLFQLTCRDIRKALGLIFRMGHDEVLYSQLMHFFSFCRTLPKLLTFIKSLFCLLLSIFGDYWCQQDWHPEEAL